MANVFFRLTVGKKLLIGFSVLIILALVIAFVGYNQFNRFKDTTDLVINNNIIMTKLKRTESLIAFMKGDVDRYLLGRTESKACFNLHFGAALSILDSLEKGGGIDKEKIDDLREAVTKFEQSSIAIMKLKDAGASKEELKQQFNILDTKENDIEEKNQVLILYEGKRMRDSVKEQKSSIDTGKNLFLIVGIIITAGGLLIAFIVSRGITKALLKLTKGAETIGKGNLEYRIDIKSKDELGQLAAAFNQMVERRSQAEVALQKSEYYFRSLLQNMHEDILVIDKDYKITDINDIALITSGRKREDTIGSHCYEVSHGLNEPCSRNGKECILDKVFETGEPDSSIHEHIYADGSKVWVDVLSSPLRDEKGNVTRVIQAIRDMTEIRRSKEELQKHQEHLEEMVEERTAELDKRVSEVEQLNSAMVNLLEDLRVSKENLDLTTHELRDANKELQAFAYSVSHDLRAPLRAIDGFSRILVEDYGGKLDAEGQRQLDIIQTSARQTGQLIDDLLSFSRLGRKEMSTFGIDMGALVEDVLKRLQLGIPGRLAQVNVDTLPPAKGDPAMIREVLANLLSNCIKFTKHKDDGVIEVAGTVDRDENTYSVKDNGVGFDMKYADKLFNVFQRLHSVEEFEGTGIGLALVQRIIHRHGGRVWAEGKVNEGATFYFTLPIKEETENA